jgi:hypothetical protein
MASTKDVYFVLGFVGFVGSLLWIVIAAILMLRAPSSETAPLNETVSAT